MSGDAGRTGPDGWSAVPAREPGHLPDAADGLEARPTAGASAEGSANGRVHGRPAPQYGEYAPEGWVNPVLVEQERREQEERSRALRQQAAQEATRGRRPGTADGTVAAGRAARAETADGSGRTVPAQQGFGASPIDFVLSVGLLVIGLMTVLQGLSIGTTASTMRTYLEQQYTELSDPAALSTAVLVRAVVLVVVFALVVWWSIRRLRARRRTFWVPLVGGIVASVLGIIPVFVVILQDPAFTAYLHRMAGG